MKVNIDLQAANNLNSGIGVFANQQALNLAKFDDLQLFGGASYVRALSQKDFERFPFPVKYSHIPHKLVYSSKIDVLPFSYEWMLNNTADVNLFCSYHIPHVKFKKPVVACIHDLIPLETSMESMSIANEYKRIVDYTIERVDKIITVSEYTRNDLMNYYDIPENKIDIIYNGVNYEDFSKQISNFDLENVRKKYKLPQRFILYFGAIRKHKNIPNLLQAYALLDPNIRSEIKLVTRGNDDLKKLASDLGITNDVCFTGFIDDVDKVALYQLAEISTFISLYEGFGIPIIEAQAAGTPVITSNTSSMPEASGRAALLVDPQSPEEIADAMKQLIENDEMRLEIIKRGKKNAQKFSWDSSSKKLHDVLISL